MTEINVPGDEVERLGALLRRVTELIDTKTSGFDAADVGPPLAGSGANFDDEWKDGRFQVKRNTKDLKDACEAIIKAFADADNQQADALKGDGSTAGDK
ncbi:hypothetical protein B7755_004060 [Streptomyces sp. NBS 14/10]|uniref:hypothetical protein n=1 Tax=Streptomyces sp. NBS 14/10 TaxID=1945643 RepID=UPI000B7E0F9F|nr:hypothetical protein [Streptomyces sp. NBS 14/10]KAK1177403.1 hypothetical protein B7755_004060 [Streptomyces sp. NBS 14/10]NUS81694.1 hypothetical protein [Streptomyces sp.]